MYALCTKVRNAQNLLAHISAKKIVHFFSFHFFKVLDIGNLQTKNEKNSTTDSPSKWPPNMTLFDTLTAAAGSEMGPSQNSLHGIKSTRDAQEGKQEKIGIFNFH